MVALSKPSLDKFSPIKTCKPTTNTNTSTNVPIIDLSKPDSKSLLVKACEEFGFFKVINHGVEMEIVKRLESEAIKFFSLPQSEKDKAGPAQPFGYGNKRIGPNGDVGWVEYLLLKASPRFIAEYPNLSSLALNDYISCVKKLGCGVVELLAQGAKVDERNVLSKYLMDEESDSVFRVNHYPPCPDLDLSGRNLIGFGEHTDPQIISILTSNNTSGLQIKLQDGSWLPVPPDENSFFFILGDSMQVMSNGRFKSVKHRVLANGVKSRLSMIYFGAPALNEKITPITSLLSSSSEEEEMLYEEFTWLEYKQSAYKSRLGDNRLCNFQKHHGSQQQ